MISIDTFTSGLKSLSKAFKKYNNADGQGQFSHSRIIEENIDELILRHWELKPCRKHYHQQQQAGDVLSHDDFEESYLFHPSLHQRIVFNKQDSQTSDNNNNNSNNIVHTTTTTYNDDVTWYAYDDHQQEKDYEDQHVMIEEEIIIQDADCYSSPIQQHQNQQQHQQHQQHDVHSSIIDVQWTFSIVYSHVWSVPVLYFQLQYANGILLNRKQVMDVLKFRDHDMNNNDATTSNRSSTIQTNNDNNSNSKDGWNFVSQEEHPITGVPTFFLHPCQTSTRMDLVHDTFNGSSSSRNSNVYDDDNPAQWILTWMSMLLPTVGFKIPPTVFCKLQTMLISECNI
jgi:ubiquitin-like-conjugating enzyme ATG10